MDGGAVLTEVVDSGEGFGTVADEGFFSGVLPVKKKKKK